MNADAYVYVDMLTSWPVRSRYFSAAAADPEGRTTLVDNIHALYTQFGLDGIDDDFARELTKGMESLFRDIAHGAGLDGVPAPLGNVNRSSPARRVAVASILMSLSSVSAK